eukprot:562266-Pelagomonas_calceolata.AAC.3
MAPGGDCGVSGVDKPLLKARHMAGKAKKSLRQPEGRVHSGKDNFCPEGEQGQNGALEQQANEQLSLEERKEAPSQGKKISIDNF